MFVLRRLTLIGIVVCVWSHVALGQAHYGREAGFGALAVGANIFYMPAKLVYAVLGGVTGGIAYLLTAGDERAAKGIWSPTLGGTYVVTPAMLRNEEPIMFSGVSYSSE